MFDDKYKIIGINIQEYRKIKGYTQQRLSSLSGISRARISDIERGKGPFNIVSLFLIAKALNVELSEILKQRY